MTAVRAVVAWTFSLPRSLHSLQVNCVKKAKQGKEAKVKKARKTHRTTRELTRVIVTSPKTKGISVFFFPEVHARAE